jgi:hypothetical protein
LATQRGRLAGGDSLGSDGIGKSGVQLLDAALYPIGPVALVVEALPQIRNGRPQLLDGALDGADGPGVVRGGLSIGRSGGQRIGSAAVRSCPGGQSGGGQTLLPQQSFRSLAGFVQGDKHSDNAVVADLARPALAADQTLRGCR